MHKKTGVLGFEPRLTDPESVVLPLHYTPKSVAVTRLLIYIYLKRFATKFGFGWSREVTMPDIDTKAISKRMNLFLESIAVILISKGILMFIPF